MGKYALHVGPSVPVDGDDQLTIAYAAAESAKVIEVTWGGNVTTSSAQTTDVSRSTAGTTPTAGNPVALHPNSVATVAVTNIGPTGWATEPTLVAGSLLSLSWNAHGGVVRWLAAPGEEFVVIGAATSNNISVRNQNASNASATFGIIWEDD